jgi:hypothetical protein
MAGLMLSIFVAAMDSTVVGTALPTIANPLDAAAGTASRALLGSG